jgi:hypothetical protein
LIAQGIAVSSLPVEASGGLTMRAVVQKESWRVVNTEAVQSPISEEQLLQRKAADAHVALLQFMNRTPLPFSPCAKEEYEQLLTAVTNARTNYLKVANALGIGPLQPYSIR